jgi:hypothetical protein
LIGYKRFFGNESAYWHSDGVKDCGAQDEEKALAEEKARQEKREVS